MKKILILDLTPFFGGGEKYLVDISLYLQKNYELHFIIPKLEKFITLLTENVKVTTLSQTSYIKFPSIIRKVNRYIKDENIDYIIVNGNRPLYLTPFIKHKDIVFIKHFPFDAIPFFKRIIAIPLSYFCYIFCRKLIFVADYARKELICFKGKSVTIHNGVDTNYWQIESRLKNEKLVISLIARVEKYKGQIELINAVKHLVVKYSNIEVRLIGDGSYLDFVKQYIRENGLEPLVKIFGFSDKIKEHLSETDIFVLPSKFELFPISILEAMSCEIPVISTKIAGIPEMINMETGVLIDAGNELQLIEALDKLISNSELRKKIGFNARKSVCENFNIKLTCQKITNVLNKL